MTQLKQTDLKRLDDVVRKLSVDVCDENLIEFDSTIKPYDVTNPLIKGYHHIVQCYRNRVAEQKAKQLEQAKYLR
jgi:hypothetical protein